MSFRTQCWIMKALTSTECQSWLSYTFSSEIRNCSLQQKSPSSKHLPIALKVPLEAPRLAPSHFMRRTVVACSHGRSFVLALLFSSVAPLRVELRRVLIPSSGIMKNLDTGLDYLNLLQETWNVLRIVSRRWTIRASDVLWSETCCRDFSAIYWHVSLVNY